jgi:hypothetical protein
MVSFSIAVSLSISTLAGPLVWIPNILNFYCKPFINSVAMHRATNFDPKKEVSNVFCALEYHMIGERLR